MREPRTDEEWKEAADLALYWWRFDRARYFGIIKGGPEVDREWCREILLRASVRGQTPEARDLEKALFGG